MNFTDYEAAFEAEEKEQKYVGYAKGILRVLKEVREKPEDTQRRWIWELVQNAKDERATEVRIERHADRLCFEHNGGPFQVRHQISLLNGNSSKSIAGAEQGKTGKFGTGFISTHILGERVEVRGVVTHNGQQARFMLPLDRRGETPAALALGIKQSEIQLRREENLQELINTKTSFTYFHDTERQKSAASAGIQDLVNTLPFTLVTLAGQLQTLEIADYVSNNHQAYRCEVIGEKIEASVDSYCVSTTDSITNELINARYLLCFAAPGLQLLAEVADLATYSLMTAEQARPMLYWDFPLVGTEKFYFPFVLNGQPFYPTNARDGIELNNSESTDVTHNRSVVEQAQQAATQFSAWLIQQGTQNRFLLAVSRVPQGLIGDKNAQSAKAWYEKNQKVWRAQLRKLALVEPETGHPAITLEQSRIPRFQADVPTKQSDHEDLWELAAPLWGEANLPRKSHLIPWIEVIGIQDEYDSWGLPIWLSQEDLLKRVAEAKCLSNLPVGSDDSTRLLWLKQLYGFLKFRNLEKLLNEYAVVPNCYGEFRSLELLYQENVNDAIPSAVLDILAMLDHNWRSDLLHSAVALALPDLPEARVYGLQKASSKINEELNRYNYDTPAVIKDTWIGPAHPAGVPRSEAHEIAVLVAIQQLQLREVSPDKFRAALLPLAQALCKFEYVSRFTDRLSTFDFQGPTYRWLRLLNTRLAATGSVGELMQKLGYSYENEVIVWLDEYLSLVYDSQFRLVVSEKPIVPNRQQYFKLRSELQAYGTDQEPLDEVLLRLLAELADGPDQRANLVADGLKLPLEKSPYTRRQLGDDFTAALRLAIYSDDIFAQHQTTLADFVKWCSQNSNRAKDFVPKIIDESLHHRISYLVLERSGKTGQVMELAGHEALPDLLAIVASKVDIKELRKLAELIRYNPDMMHRLLESAKDERREHMRFISLVAIGRIMEDLFAAALEKAGISTEIQKEVDQAKAFSRYYGIGSYDFAIINSAEPDKKFLIELKSFAKGPNPQPIRLALSQVGQAAHPEYPYGLCVVGREDIQEVTVEQVEENLRYYRDLSEPMLEIESRLNQLREWQKEQQPLRLELPDFNKSKIRIAHEFLNETARFLKFDKLVEDIHEALR